MKATTEKAPLMEEGKVKKKTYGQIKRILKAVSTEKNHLLDFILLVIAVLAIVFSWGIYIPDTRVGVLILIIVLLMTYHRILAWTLGFLVRTLMDKHWTGAFNIHIDWIAFRLGLDQNQICIYGVEWKNPKFFTNTPYLLRVGEITIEFAPLSILNAFFRGKAMKIPEIKLDGITMHIEKATEEEVLAAKAAGFIKSDSQMKQEAKSLDKVHDDLLRKQVAALKKKGAPQDQIDALQKQIDAPLQVRDQIHVGMINLFAAIGATKPAHEASLMEIIRNSMKNAVDESDNLLEHLHAAIFSGKPEGAKAAIDKHMNDEVDDDEEDDDGEGFCPCVTGTGDTPAAQVEGQPASTRGFGVPFRFEIDEFYLARVEIHAQDFLTASHVKDSDLSAIKISLLSMFRRDDLSKPNPKGGRRLPLYLDEVVFRLLNKLIAILLAENGVAFMSLIGGAMVNRTTAVVTGAVEGVENMFTSIGNFFSGGRTKAKPGMPRNLSNVSNASADSKDEGAITSFFSQTFTSK
jgi:hypothetical protein